MKLGSRRATDRYRVELINETALAILVLNEYDAEQWIPKSRIEFEDHKDGTCTIECDEQAAEDFGLV